MTTQPTRQKPANVQQAEWILWAWVVWVSVFGVFQTWRNIPDIEQAINDQLQGMVTIAPDGMMQATVAGYAALAALYAWFIYKTGQGKHWARSSVLWGFALQTLMTLAPPYHALAEYLGDIPDLGLQAVAVYLLYKKSSRNWFKPPIKNKT